MSPCRSNSVIPQEKQNGSEKDRQAIPYDKDEANKSIEENGSKKLNKMKKKQLNKERANKRKLQEIRLSIFLI